MTKGEQAVILDSIKDIHKISRALFAWFESQDIPPQIAVGVMTFTLAQLAFADVISERHLQLLQKMAHGLAKTLYKDNKRRMKQRIKRDTGR